MIPRNLHDAAGSAHDLIVVGGGVYGVALTLEAVRRGLRPLLVERDDFGAKTSWNSLRIAHGGLRYLQTLDLHRFRESVGERSWLLTTFPEQLRPLPCVMPLYGDGLRRPAVLRLALAANDLLSRTALARVRSNEIHRGRVLSRSETIDWFPRVRRAGLRGAALWYDASMPSSQRVLIEMLRWACSRGATALNYVEGRKLLQDGAAVTGLQVEDRESGNAVELRAPVVVNCAGPWSRQLATVWDRDVPELFEPSIALNALLDREPLSRAGLAVAPRIPDSRIYFLVPWQGRILAGTYHASHDGPPAESVDLDRHVAEFLRHLNLAIPGLELRREEVLRVHWGYLPVKKRATTRLAVREVILDHGDRAGPVGLFSVSGVKFTTARLVAQKTLARVFATRGARLPAAGDSPRPEPTQVPTLDSLREMLRSDPGGAATRVRRLIHEEAVRHLDDLFLRRTDWGMDPRQARSLARPVAELLDWDEPRIAAELARLERLIA